MYKCVSVEGASAKLLIFSSAETDWKSVPRLTSKVRTGRRLAILPERHTVNKNRHEGSWGTVVATSETRVLRAGLKGAWLELEDPPGSREGFANTLTCLILRKS